MEITPFDLNALSTSYPVNSVDLNHIVKKVKRLRELGKSAIIFLGAGASKSAGIPTAEGIVNYILNDDSLSLFVQGVGSQNYFEVMGRLDPGERYRVLKKFIEKAAINETHLVIGLLVTLGYVDCVVTTNFDPLIKRALILLSKDIPIYDLPNNLDLSSKQINYPAVFHLHGELENVWQYNTLEKLKSEEEKIGAMITRIAPDRAWIVVGYSGGDKDPIFRKLSNFEKFNEGLFWIGYKENKPPILLEEKLLSDRTKNVHYISGYDSDEFFISLFEGLVKQPSKELANYLRIINPIVQRRFQLNQAVLNEIKKPIDSGGVSTKTYCELASKFENSIQLTPNCKAWIKKQIEKPTTIEFQSKPLGIVDKLINLIAPSFYYEQKVLNHVKVLLNEKSYRKASNFLSSEIQKSGDNPFYYYYYGVTLGEIAQSIANPEKRKGVYLELVGSFNKAEENFRKLGYVPTESENIEIVRKVLWSKEHNRAIELATKDDLEKIGDHPIKQAIIHLKNATVILPNNSLSWDVLAQVYYMDNNLKGAIKAMEIVVEKKSSLTVDDYLRLSGYYRLNKQPEQAITVLKKAREAFPQNVQIVQNLADAYTNAERIDESITIIEELIEQDPENPQYRLVMGTQIYQTVLQLNEELKDNHDQMFNPDPKARAAGGDEAQQIEQKISELEQRNEQIQSRINSLMERATKEIKIVIKHRPNDDVAYNTLGVIYQNKAAALFEERNQEQGKQEAAVLDQKVKKMLRQFMKYYEKAAEINPDKKEYWKSLLSIYTTLNMDKKANKTLEKINQR